VTLLAVTLLFLEALSFAYAFLLGLPAKLLAWLFIVLGVGAISVSVRKVCESFESVTEAGLIGQNHV